MKTQGDVSLIQEALYALLQNAVEAASRGGCISVSVETFDGWHRLSVSDDGAGVARADLENLSTLLHDEEGGLGPRPVVRPAHRAETRRHGRGGQRGRGARREVRVGPAGLAPGAIPTSPSPSGANSKGSR